MASDEGWVVEDDTHAELIGEFPSRKAAIEELRRLATQSWDGPDNRAPCTSWETCTRRYVLRRADAAYGEGEEALHVGSKGTRWRSTLLGSDSVVEPQARPSGHVRHPSTVTEPMAPTPPRVTGASGTRGSANVPRPQAPEEAARRWPSRAAEQHGRSSATTSESEYGAPTVLMAVERALADSAISFAAVALNVRELSEPPPVGGCARGPRWGSGGMRSRAAPAALQGVGPGP